MRGPKLSPQLLEDIRSTQRLNRDEIVRRELKRREAETAAEGHDEAKTLVRAGCRCCGAQIGIGGSSGGGFCLACNNAGCDTCGTCCAEGANG